MKSPTWVVPAMVIGIGLLVFASWIPSLMPSQAVWTDENASEFNKAAAEFHNTSHRHAHRKQKSHSGAPHVHSASTADPLPPEVAAAKAEFDKQQAKLDGARTRVKIYKYLCQAVGIVLAATGAGMYLHLRIKGGR